MEGYGVEIYQPASSVVTEPSGPLLHTPPVKDYLVWSMVNVIFFFPFGICALMFSIKTRDAKNQNNAILAAKYSSTAEGMNAAATVIGIFLNLVLLVVHFVFPLSNKHTP